MLDITKTPAKKALDICAHRWAWATAYGYQNTLIVGALDFGAAEGHGGKRKALVRGLLLNGYLAEGSYQGGAHDTQKAHPVTRVTSKAYDALVTEQPDLAGRIPDDATAFGLQDRPPGVSFEDLAPGARKYVLTHPGYEFGASNRISGGWRPATIGKFGEALGLNASSNDYILVRDAAFREKLARLTLDARVRETAATNIGALLAHVGLDAATAKLIGPADLLNGIGFKQDPAGWPGDWSRSVEMMEATIRAYQRKVAAYATLIEFVESNGGWPAVTEKMLAALRQHIDAEPKEQP